MEKDLIKEISMFRAHLLLSASLYQSINDMYESDETGDLEYMREAIDEQIKRFDVSISINGKELKMDFSANVYENLLELLQSELDDLK